MSIKLLKLGGSIITDKAQQNTHRPAILANLLEQIVRARQFWYETQAGVATRLILAHGQGSFAHVPAAAYQITRGLIQPGSEYGMAVVLAAVALLNRLVIDACLAAGLAAVPWFAAQAIVTSAKKLKTAWLKVLDGYLDRGLIPVTTGDVVVDEKQGCAVWSGETVLNFLAERLVSQGKKVECVIQVGEVPGVLDHDQQVIPTITPESWQRYQTAVSTQTKGVDVTGGMLQKVTESLQLAQTTGIETWIIDGTQPDNLYHALTGGDWKGTRITAGPPSSKR